ASRYLNWIRRNSKLRFYRRLSAPTRFSELLLVFTWTCALLLCASICRGTEAGVGVPQSPSVSPGLPFAVADFDGDLLPDVAAVQIGQSGFAQTDYWIQVQLSASGRQTIHVMAPSGGLQVTAKDLNGDLAPDLVLTTSWSREPVAVYLNDGHGRFTRVDPA